MGDTSFPRLRCTADSLPGRQEVILGIIVEIEAAARSRRSLRYVGGLFHCLIDDTVQHFVDEERVMVARAYPLLAVHRSLHAAMLDHLNRLASDYGDGLISLNRPILDNLRRWYFVHRCTQDQLLAAFLAAPQRTTGERPAPALPRSVPG